MNAKLSLCSKAFYCKLVLSNRLVLSVNSTLNLQRDANIVCYISENKVNHLLLPDKGIHYSFPPEDAQVYSQMCLWHGYFPKRRVGSDVLTRTRPTSKLMNKLSIHIFSFS